MLHVHRSERADALVAALGAVLADPLPDPLAPELIAVPTRGVERWLTQRLASTLGASQGRSDGVCANVEFPSPRELVGEAVTAASGIEPDEDPWRPERVAWPLLEVIDDCLSDPQLHSVGVALGAGPDPVRRARRLASVRHLADLFDRYALQRPEMLVAWAALQDTDGGPGNLPADAVWQAELWRRLDDRIASPDPVRRLQDACARLYEDPDVVSLPRRVSLFGLTRLPPGHLRVLGAMAEHRDVHLFLLAPSPELWDRVARATMHAPAALLRSADATASQPVNPLLASWGADARELQLVLQGAGGYVDHHHPIVATEVRTLLDRIQADIRADRCAPGAPLPGLNDARAQLDGDDRSLEIHACHGTARQVEVVRDAILHLLARDPSLEPRDIIVMCPDVETFAPLIQATFGAGQTADTQESGAPAPDLSHIDLRVRLADRSLRQTNPLLAVIAVLLELVEQRLTASQVLDLADREPVRRRFGLHDDDLGRLREWVADSGIRWGLDGAHRAPFGLEGLGAGTWRTGIDRILLGATMTEEQQTLYAGVLALDDVGSGAIELVGRFAELLERLETVLDDFAAAKTIKEWARAIRAGADALTLTTQREDSQRAELERLLDDVVSEATTVHGVSSTVITCAEVRALLADRLRGRPTRANFRTGHLTVCTLVPMRSVPHRVVCLLGLDDGVFPRRAAQDGDDLLLAHPHVGDRHPRTEDRQLLLDALLAAGEHLIVTYTGNDERTNAPRPCAVALGELLDVVDATARVSDGRTRDRVVVRHPLQDFDPRNFARGALVANRTWSFDPVTLEGARALTGTRAAPGPFLRAPLPALPTAIVEIEDLVRFVEHPVRAFLRRRLGISVTETSDEVADDLHVDLDGLAKWGVGQRLLEARLAGVNGRTAALAEIARGLLPPGGLGRPVIAEVLPVVEEVVAAAQALIAGGESPGGIDAAVALSDGRWLRGTVSGVSGAMLRTVTFSRVSAKHRLAAWVRLLVLTAAFPQRPFGAATVGRARAGSAAGSAVTIARIAPLAGDVAGRRQTALGHLETVVALCDRGMCEPLALYCETSAAYAQAVRTGDDPVAAGRRAWTSDWKIDREDRDPAHQLVLGGMRAFDELLAEAPRVAEQEHQGRAVTETTDLGRYARRMWDDLLDCEEVVAR